MKHILNMVDVRRGGAHRNLKFKDHFDTVHIDECWFYFMSNDGKVLLVDDIDVLVLPQCQHKSHIEKIMFITAMARPRMFPDGTWFDGKIGKKNDANRPTMLQRVSYG